MHDARFLLFPCPIPYQTDLLVNGFRRINRRVGELLTRNGGAKDKPALRNGKRRHAVGVPKSSRGCQDMRTTRGSGDSRRTGLDVASHGDKRYGCLRIEFEVSARELFKGFFVLEKDDFRIRFSAKLETHLKLCHLGCSDLHDRLIGAVDFGVDTAHTSCTANHGSCLDNAWEEGPAVRFVKILLTAGLHKGILMMNERKREPAIKLVEVWREACIACHRDSFIPSQQHFAALNTQ